MSIYKEMFNGSDYVPERDDVRLSGQIKRVYVRMSDGLPRTFRQISNATGDPEASVSAQLRHLKKERFGGFIVEKEHVGNGLYRYWMMPPPEKGQGVLDV